MANFNKDRIQTETIKISRHGIERMNQRGIEIDTISMVQSEGSVTRSKYNDGRTEIFFSRTDQQRAESEIKMEIAALENLRKKNCGKEIKDGTSELSNDELSLKISILRKKLQKIGKAANKKLVFGRGDTLVTCYHKNKQTKNKCRRRRRRRTKYTKYIKGAKF